MKRVIAFPALIGVFVLACERAPTSTDTLALPETPSLAVTDNDNRDRQALAVEFAGASDFTDATMVGDELGWSQLKRDPGRLKAVVHANGLKPGGVFTFWWVGVQDDATFPDDIFVALGASAVIGQNGKATVYMSAAKGDQSIVGLPALGGLLFGDLVDPENALVRVEVAYHGQVEDAGDDLGQWRSDFWTGSVCPQEGVNAAGQPHCPVYFAATHAPPGA
jgi:hypothetical protein